MKKIYKLEALDCANCASKMETRIGKIRGVSQVNISFMTGKMTIEAEDTRFNEIIQDAQKIIKKIEPDCRIVL